MLNSSKSSDNNTGVIIVGIAILLVGAILLYFSLTTSSISSPPVPPPLQASIPRESSPLPPPPLTPQAIGPSVQNRDCQYTPWSECNCLDEIRQGPDSAKDRCSCSCTVHRSVISEALGTGRKCHPSEQTKTVWKCMSENECNRLRESRSQYAASECPKDITLPGGLQTYSQAGLQCLHEIMSTFDSTRHPSC